MTVSLYIAVLNRILQHYVFPRTDDSVEFGPSFDAVLARVADNFLPVYLRFMNVILHLYPSSFPSVKRFSYRLPLASSVPGQVRLSLSSLLSV